MPPPRVLVTGSNRGLGLEFVRQYAADGWDVVGTCRAPDAADDLKAVEGAVEVLRLDVTSDDDIDAVVSHLGGRPVDLLISNAAMLGGSRSRIDDLNRNAWVRAFETNVVGAIRVPIALRPNVAASSGRRVVVLGSRAGLAREARAGQSYIYRSTKSALTTAARILALDLLDDDIVTAIVNPGHVRTGIGGKRATMEASESVGRLRETIAGLTRDDAGRFWSYDGSELSL